MYCLSINQSTISTNPISFKTQFVSLKSVQVKGLSDLLKSDLDKGASPNEDELLQRRNIYGANTYPRKKRKNILVCHK